MCEGVYVNQLNIRCISIDSLDRISNFAVKQFFVQDAAIEVFRLLFDIFSLETLNTRWPFNP
ncbi:MAG: hypothetical protein LBT78_07635 [Tannerella sp.]|nr:hypothetical protein [Tannerella sp.]